MTTTTSFRAAILKAFHKIGGVKHLAEWAEDNPTEFYKLAGRLLAQEKPPEPPAMAVTGKFTVQTQLEFSNETGSAGSSAAVSAPESGDLCTRTL